MLELKKISKVYQIGNEQLTALNEINLTFTSGEFVSILGPSGGGKTTLLNIIGGLDQYTDGDLIIKGKSTKDFESTDWDAYRNNSVGFIFQNYNLIPHISVLENVELGMTISGVEHDAKRKKAIDLLTRVGLKEQMNKKPGKLSGGQKQRVAIARALANNPEIILADEPTGALDTESSKQIMDLIQEISQEKIVIMVTHNPILAKVYSTRIVELLDGQIINDTNPPKEEAKEMGYHLTYTNMGFLVALVLSFNNLKTKVTRTLITAFAGSIGIIGVALVLAVSTGFSQNIKLLESETLYSLPISITRHTTSINLNLPTRYQTTKELVQEGVFNIYDASLNQAHTNKITFDYLEYVNQLNDKLYTSIEYKYGLRDVLLNQSDIGTRRITVSRFDWYQLSYDKLLLSEHFDIVAGDLPKAIDELVVIIDKNNRIGLPTLQGLNIDVTNEVLFEEVIGKEIVYPYSHNLYTKIDGLFQENTDYTSLYQSGQKLTISGVIKVKEDSTLNMNYGVYYQQELKEELISINQQSEICNKQREVDYNVLNGESFISQESKLTQLQYLGCDLKPTAIHIYPASYEAKEQIKTYLEQYNLDRTEEDKLLFTDFASNVGEALGTIIGMISTILVAFAGISLLVSSIMIGIITYVSVLERTKEIGVLRAIGARRKDISRVFNAEAVIVGLVAGLMGITLTFLLSYPLNILFNNLNQDFTNLVQLKIEHAFLLIIISVLLTFISGLIPSMIASRKDPVEALRHNE